MVAYCVQVGFSTPLYACTASSNLRMEAYCCADLRKNAYLMRLVYANKIKLV